MHHQPVEPDTPDAPIPVEPEHPPPTPDDERERPHTVERTQATAFSHSVRGVARPGQSTAT